jgi:hypothetical protein
MIVRERGVIFRMPVLGQDHAGKLIHQGIDLADHLISSGYGQRTSGAEVVLNIDDNQRFTIWPHHTHPFPPVPRGKVPSLTPSTLNSHSPIRCSKGNARAESGGVWL